MVNITKDEQEEIRQYMEDLQFKYLTKEEADKIEDYVLLHFMDIIKRPNTVYSLTLFNAYMDDNDVNDCPRFHYRMRDPRLFLENGKKNPNYGKEYVRVF